MQVRCALDGGQDKRFLANQTKTGHFDSKLSKITDLRSDKRKIRENSRKKKKKRKYLPQLRNYLEYIFCTYLRFISSFNELI